VLQKIKMAAVVIGLIAGVAAMFLYAGGPSEAVSARNQVATWVPYALGLGIIAGAILAWSRPEFGGTVMMVLGGWYINALPFNSTTAIPFLLAAIASACAIYVYCEANPYIEELDTSDTLHRRADTEARAEGTTL
jgi:hypothetical protein